MKWFLIFISFYAINLLCTSCTPVETDSDSEPVRMVVAGLSHGHAHWLFQHDFTAGIPIVGIFEPDRELVSHFKNRYNIDESLFYDDLNKMLEKTQPEGLLAFGPVYNHLEVVEAAAPRGIHVMVEKPLAVSLEHAREMQRMAGRYKIHLLTNYETSWYPSTEWTRHLLIEESGRYGKLRKAVFHHGHQGPKEIGVGPKFLEWLTDPKLNGGGAITDFGCYGANIMTYLTGGQTPLSVRAIIRTYKPDTYPHVDDDATIIVTYPEAQAIIQASWNWPYSRKDMDIYGVKGSITVPDANNVITRSGVKSEISRETITAEMAGIEPNPIQYFAGVIRGTIQPQTYSLYSLENNVMVVKILEAAKKSAKTGQKVDFEPDWD